MRTIPWARLLCEMGTASPFLRCTAAKHGISNEPFYHKEPVMPIKADACSRGTPGRVEHRARNASGHREDMPHCRSDDVRGGFVLYRCVEHRPTWHADAIVDIVKRRYSSQLSCRPRLLFTLALCYEIHTSQDHPPPSKAAAG